jgi:hypothetical protein
MPNSVLKTLCAFAFFTILILAQPAAAQPGRDAPEGVLLRIEMQNGDVYTGRRLAMTDEEIIINTATLGKLNLPLALVGEIRELQSGELLNGKFVPFNHQAHQNLVSPTAFAMSKGSVELHNFMLAFNQIGFGINDWFSLHVATELISPIASLSEGEFGGPGLMIRPHFSYPVAPDKLTLGGGLAIIGIPFSGKPVDVIAPYAVATLGNRHTHLNISAGLAFGKEDPSFFFPPTPQRSKPLIFSTGGQVRLGRSVAITSENWVWSDAFDTLFINTLGVRLFSTHAAWSVALLGTGGDGFYFVSPIPAASVTIKLK